MYRVSMILQNKLRIFDLMGGGRNRKNNLFQTEEQKNKFSFDTPQICSFVLLSELIRIIRINPD